MEQNAEPITVDFQVLGRPLNDLLIATGNKLSREWPAKYREVIGARELLVMNLRAAHKTYLSALYLCGDKPPDPRREVEFCVCLAPVNRALLDSLFTIIFLLEDLPCRCQWFYEAGWRESRLELDRHVAEYGHLPEWKGWLSELTSHVNTGITFAGLTPEQAADPRGLRTWPNAGAMCSYGVSASVPLTPERAFMKYLYDFYYIDLSQQTHLADGWGTTKRTAFLLDQIRALPSTDALIRKYRQSQVRQTVIFALALATEVEAHFNFGLRTEAQYVWGVAAPLIVMAGEMYGKRYQELLKIPEAPVAD